MRLYHFGLLSFLLAIHAWAASVDFYEDKLVKDPNISAEVNQLHAGDRVRLIAPGGRVLADYLLGPYLDKGEMSRVFELAHPDGTRTALKIQNGSKNAVRALNQEVRAHDMLDEAGIANARPLRQFRNLMIEKEFVDGITLYQACKRWSSLSLEERTRMIAALPEAYKKIRNKNFYFTDIHSGNIMWDRANSRWVVIDPGSASYNSMGNYRGHDFMRDVLEDSPAAYDAFFLAKKDPQWLASFLKLEDAVASINAHPTSEAIARFRSEVAPNWRKAPALYKKLVNRGDALAANYGEPKSRRRFLRCIQGWLTSGS